MAPDRVRRDQRAVEDEVRPQRHQDAILAARRLALGAVRDDHRPAAGAFGDGTPLAPDRKAGAAATLQSGCLERGDQGRPWSGNGPRRADGRRGSRRRPRPSGRRAADRRPARARPTRPRRPASAPRLTRRWTAAPAIPRRRRWRRDGSAERHRRCDEGARLDPGPFGESGRVEHRRLLRPRPAPGTRLRQRLSRARRRRSASRTAAPTAADAGGVDDQHPGAPVSVPMPMPWSDRDRPERVGQPVDEPPGAKPDPLPQQARSPVIATSRYVATDPSPRKSGL